MSINRKEIYWVDLGEGVGSEQAGVRPCLVYQCRLGNLHSPTTKVIPISTSKTKAKLPTHVMLPSHKTNLKNDSVLLAEQSRTVDKQRIGDKIGEVDNDLMRMVEKAMWISDGYEFLEPAFV
jgi:mRNA interferase MazF